MHSTIAEALDVLLDPGLEKVVELVAYRTEHAYVARAVDGAVEFRQRKGGAGRPQYEVTSVDGRDPLAEQSAERLAGVDSEISEMFVTRGRNSYPVAFERLAQVLDAPHAPDLVVLHTAAHNWAAQGGHIGEHGSLGVVQSRAPFIIGGPGVRASGRVERAAQLVDVAPTVAAAMGLPSRSGRRFDGRERVDARLAAQDGDVLDGVLDGERPGFVLGLLIDGTNANVLHDAIDAGEVPNIARLAERGTTFAHGAIASLPTVTLANHTTVMTGCHPGHHGILHNAWWDRERQRQIITNDAKEWAHSMQHLRPEVETLHEAIRRHQPEAFTVSINEPADRGASYSTFDMMRRGIRMGFPKSPDGLPHATERFVRPFKDYAWYSRVDHHGVEQALGVLGGEYLGQAYPPARYAWVNFTLTDSAFHEGGPHSDVARASLADTDGRIGEILQLLVQQGRFDDTLVYLVADHGMEQSDPSVTGDWDEALRAAGVDFRDEAYGFVYLNPGTRERSS